MKKIIPILIFISLSFSASAKTNIDSLLDLLNKKQRDSTKAMTLYHIAVYYANIDSKKGIEYGNQALNLSEQKGFKRGQAAALYAIGLSFRKNDQYKVSSQYYERSLKIYREILDVKGQGRMLSNLANNYNSLGDYKTALDLYFKALRMKEGQSDSAGMAYALGNIATAYFNMDQKKPGGDYLLRSLVIFKKLGNKKEIARSYYNMAQFMQNGTDKCDSGVYYMRRAISILDEIGEVKMSAEDKIGLAGRIYECGNREEGKKIFEEALKTSLEKKYVTTICDAYGNLSLIYNDEKNYEKSLDYSTKALEIARQMNDRFRLKNIYRSLNIAYRGKNDFKNAYSYLSLYVDVKDSMLNESMTKQFAEMQTKYESEVKDKELIKNEAEKKQLEADADQKSLQRNAFIVGFLLMILLAIFIFRGYRLKQKANVDISHQKAVIEEKNKEIMDSITYAKSLQDAILPPSSFVKQYFPESFIFYRPKDVVAGDFYWMEVDGDNIFLAAADCTGHGVPGALVSVVCSNALNRAVKEFGITETGKILDKVRDLIAETFKKSEREVRDGMDISLIRFNKNANEAQWSGANNPLWYLRNKELKEIIPDKQPIGKTENERPFTSHKVIFEKGDSIFLFTDGFADQFGGEKGKKFKYKKMQELFLSVSERKMAEQKIIIDAAIESWKGDLEQVDDILIIGVRV